MSGRRETYGRPGLEEKWAAGTRSPAKGRPFDLLVHIERAERVREAQPTRSGLRTLATRGRGEGCTEEKRTKLQVRVSLLRPPSAPSAPRAALVAAPTGYRRMNKDGSGVRVLVLRV
jgi:hypothetical protein